MQKLTDRQRAVLEYISTSISDRGYPPTLREIGNHLGIRSTNGVNDHLRALERKGYLTREDMKSRTLRLVRGIDDADFESESAALGNGNGNGNGNGIGGARLEYASPASSRATLIAEGTGTRQLASLGSGNSLNALNALSSLSSLGPVASLASGASAHVQPSGATSIRSARGSAAPAPANDLFEDDRDDQTVAIPILGRVAAGALSEAIEHAEDSVRVDRMLLGRGGRDVFGLRIQGESMIEAGIHSGDFVFVRKQLEARRGDIVVALVGDEATCKYYFPERDHVRLEPANSTMSPIRIAASDWRNTQILGVVVGVYRRIES